MIVLVVHRGGQAVAWLRTHLRRAGRRVVAAADGPVMRDLGRLEEPTLVLVRLTYPRPQEPVLEEMGRPGMAAPTDVLELTFDEASIQRGATDGQMI